MAIDFPASPTVGQVFVVGSVTYTWDGTKWKSNATNSPFSLGSASTPSITFIGDSNTGIYSPGANQVAISTNGTGRLFVDASGNILINVATARANITDTSTPRFQIEGTDFSSSYASICRNSDTAVAGPAFALARTRGSSLGSNSALQSDDVLGTLRFEGNYGTGFNGACAIRGIAGGTFSGGNTPGQLLFLTTPVGSNGVVERLRITSAGLVGIGVSSPSQLLHLRTATSGSGASQLRLENQGATQYETGIELYSTPTTSASAFRSGRLYSYFDGSAFADSRLTLQSIGNGDVLIDTLSVKNGRVGVGTLSPASKLSVSDSGAVQIQATTGTVDFRIQSIDGNSAAYSGTVSNHAYAFTTNNSERARIDTSGRLLVGTSSDTSGGNGNALLQVVSSGPGRILPGRSDGSTAADLAIGAVDFRSFAGSAWESVATITAFSDGVSGSGDKPGRLVFSTTADGASSPTERLRITNAGRVGIGQTSPATTLDLSGSYSANAVAVAALDIDCSLGNYFTKTINANSTFTFSNPPGSRSYGFTLELTHTSGTVTWPAAVQWPGGTAPTLTTGKVHLFIFVTDDGGTIWRGSSLINYNS